jgi:hypothetical protein
MSAHGRQVLFLSCLARINDIETARDYILSFRCKGQRVYNVIDVDEWYRLGAWTHRDPASRNCHHAIRRNSLRAGPEDLAGPDDYGWQALFTNCVCNQPFRLQLRLRVETALFRVRLQLR